MSSQKPSQLNYDEGTLSIQLTDESFPLAELNKTFRPLVTEYSTQYVDPEEHGLTGNYVGDLSHEHDFIKRTDDGTTKIPVALRDYHFERPSNTPEEDEDWINFVGTALFRIDPEAELEPNPRLVERILDEESYSLYAPDLDSITLGPLAEINVRDTVGEPEDYNLMSSRAKKLRNLLGNYKGTDRYEIFEDHLQK